MLRMELNQSEREAKNLLEGGFPQVIFYGPPGTGKTRAALNVAAAILGLKDAKALPTGGDSPFAFVQFHPSYNYEDFVRGIRVETDAKNNVVYKTENRTFGEMAERAAASDNPHVLVIDEINRANVSAVLGELIYGLEYRGKEVQTPYKVNSKRKDNEGGKGEGNATLRRRLCQYSGCNGEDKGEGNAGLVIPEKLKIIGTMNTADRTIGQIDYAVRRRFAFVHCPPDVSVVENIGGARALEFFQMVDKVFECLSADHDKEDVCIGHSYFLADGVELANKIIYQVVPILREYLKDGVLVKDAGEKIREIEAKACAIPNNMSAASAVPMPPAQPEYTEGHSAWRWVHMDSGVMATPKPLRRTILSLVHHYVNMDKFQSLDEFPRSFVRMHRPSFNIIRDLNDSKVQKNPARYFTKEEEKIHLGDGSVAVVVKGWGARGTWKDRFKAFRGCAEEQGYKIYPVDKEQKTSPYWVVNTGHHNKCPHRAWENCKNYGFISGGQDDAPALSNSTASQLQRIPLGAVVFAYRSESGYVGCGVVVQKAKLIRTFIKNSREGQHGIRSPIWSVLADEIDHGGIDPDREFAIGVDWLPGRERPQGVLGDREHARPKAVQTIRPSQALDNLKREFRIADEGDDSGN